MRACPFGTVIERSEIVDVLSAMKAGKHLTAMMAPAIVGPVSRQPEARG